MVEESEFSEGIPYPKLNAFVWEQIGQPKLPLDS